MSNKDKHTPLSAEELFKLLEDKNREGFSSEESGLDDFEREALEGFSSHLPVEEARRLTQELDTKISEAVEEKGGGKKKIIWFSSAASILLLITVSVVFFYQSKDAVVQPIAFNEVSKNEEKPEMPAEAAAMGQAPGVVFKSADGNSSSLQGPEVSKSRGFASADYKNKVTADEQVVLKEERKLEQELSLMLEKSKEATPASAPVLETAESKTMSLATKDDDGYIAADQLTANYSSVQQEETASVSVASKKALRNADKNQRTYSEAKMKSGKPLDNLATYYTGGQQAVKNEVISYLKDHHYPDVLPGTIYTIQGTLLKTGKLKLNSLTVNKEEAKQTLPGMREALNSTGKWIPLQKDSSPINSDLSFDLSF